MLGTTKTVNLLKTGERSQNTEVTEQSQIKVKGSVENSC